MKINKEKQNILKELIKDLKKESTNLLFFLKKNNKLLFFILGWIMILIGFLSIFEMFFNISKYFYVIHISLSKFSTVIGLIFKIISFIFLTYSGYNILKYKKITQTTIMIYFLFHILWIIFAGKINFFLILSKDILAIIIIIIWINYNKKLFIN